MHVCRHVGVFPNLAYGGTISSNGVTFNASYSAVDLILQVAAIPEPSTWVLLAFGLTSVMILIRRRRI